MLRLYLLQNLYTLSDEATITEAIDSRAFSDFCGIASSNPVPNGDTLGRFRNILINNHLQEKLFAQVVELLQQRSLLLKKGTIVYHHHCRAVLYEKSGEAVGSECASSEEGQYMAF